MKLTYKGKYNGDPASLPCREHMPNAVQFKEFNNMKQFAGIANVIAFVLTVPLLIGLYLHMRADNVLGFFFGLLLSFVSLFPHELLHAVCFKKEVYLYTNWKQGMLFVTGPETMSKAQFIFMSLLPNLVFGFLPYIVFILFPKLTFLGVFGALNIGMGAGDYYNVFNAFGRCPRAHAHICTGCIPTGIYQPKQAIYKSKEIQTPHGLRKGKSASALRVAGQN